jgi:hypothetical protein
MASDIEDPNLEDPTYAKTLPDLFDFSSKRGRALARHRISEIDLQIASLSETKAALRAALAQSKG